MTYPTDAKLYHRMRVVLVRLAKRRGIDLRQSYVRVGKRALIKQNRYAHARQMKRARREQRRLKTYLGRVVRDIERKATSDQWDDELRVELGKAHRLLKQQRKDSHKLYSVHAPEVECLTKGKIHKRYEFGNKVSFATTSKGNWIVGAQSLQGNPYDGHTLGGALAQVRLLTNGTPKKVYCDQGYRGHGYQGEETIRIVGRIPKRATRTARSWMKRRAAIEPTIGHLKSDHRLNRNYLKGIAGNRANVLLSAAGYNLAKLLAWFYCACESWLLRTARSRQTTASMTAFHSVVLESS